MFRKQSGGHGWQLDGRMRQAATASTPPVPATADDGMSIGDNQSVFDSKLLQRLIFATPALVITHRPGGRHPTGMNKLAICVKKFYADSRSEVA